MPEENETIDLHRTLDLLEDPMLNKPLAKGQYYKAFMTALDNGTDMDVATVDRLLAVCVHDLEDDRKSVIHVLRVIQSVLKRIKAGGFSELPNLLSSILAVLNIIKTSALMSKIETMQTLCFDILLSYPNETLIEIATLHKSEVVEVLNLYCHQQIPLEIRVLPCGLILKLLKILPSEKKAAFVKDNLSVWFSKLIPTTIAAVSTLALAGNETSNVKPLETLECLTRELVPIDYSENPQWLELLECIHNPTKYPDTMKKMLSSRSDKWHRLWITFIKLLKHQITRTAVSSAVPINSMLPVVELAFKMDDANRCRAFQCWNVLIDNFKTETSEGYIVKRLKLLIIPLKSKNAKLEATALAKLKTWWHLILSFQTKLDKFVDKVLISFLHFCFGAHSGMSPKSGCIPGMLTANTKKQSVEVLVEMAGHLSCKGCVNVPKLNKGILSKAILVDYWSDWMYSLKVAISIFNEDVGVKIEQIECLWKSIIMTIAELPDNGIRKDLCTECMTMLENLEKQSEINDSSKVIFHLLCSLFGVEKIQALFTRRDAKSPMIYKVMALLMTPSLNKFYGRTDTSMLVSQLQPLAKYILDAQLVTPIVLKCPNKNNSIIVTALAKCICESKYIEVVELTELMLWPLKTSSCIIDTEYTMEVWIAFIMFMYPKINANVKDKIRSALIHDIVQSNTQLKLQLCLSVLKYELDNDSVVGCTKNVELLMSATNTIEDHKYMKNILKVLTDSVFSIINKIQDDMYSGLLQNTLTIIKNLFKFLVPLLQDTTVIDTDKTEICQNILKHAEHVFQDKANCAWYKSLTSLVVEEILNCLPLLSKYATIKTHAITIMKIFLTNTQSSDSSIFSKVKETVESLDTKIIPDKQTQPPNDAFAAPDTKSIKKKAKKETTVVNKVVDNGEEFEVIKSNWKFNPRKLTENQKEKFQRKREDIPALYQDLSQSQDEFKLSTWKTDSQDASSTNSRSTSNSKSNSTQNVSEILKNMTSSDVVPKIIENIFSDKKDAVKLLEEKVVSDATTKLKQTSNNKDPKSPRLALKDRVFRNVRNLIEKSNVQKESKDLSESLIQVENVPKTPTSKVIDKANLVNTAPANLGGERPSRMKRKPKKFDDVELISLKKSRRSSSQSCSQSDMQVEGQDSNSDPISVSSAEVSHVETDLKCPSNNDTENKQEDTEIIENQESIVKKVEKICDINNESNQVQMKELSPKPTSTESEEKISECKKESSNIQDSHCTEICTSAGASTEISKPENAQKEIKPMDVDTLVEKVSQEITPQETLSSDNNNTGKVDELTSEKSKDDVIEVVPKTTDKKPDDKDKTKGTKAVRTPKQTKTHEIVEPRSGKRNSARKSRIEKELAIDTVEGHPLLKIQTEKRMTRKNLNSSINNSRRKSLTDKLNKSKVDSKTPLKIQTTCSKRKEKDGVIPSSEMENESVVVGESQDKCSENSDDLPLSEDVIESSQDSTFTTISVKSSKPALKKLTVAVTKAPLISPEVSSPQPSTINKTNIDVLKINKLVNEENEDDTKLPANKTALMDNTDLESTENMDTMPLDSKVIEENLNSSDVIIINDDDEPPIVIGSETQEIAEADTQPTPSSETQEIADADTQPSSDLSEIRQTSKSNSTVNENADDVLQISNFAVNTEDDITTTMHETMDVSSKTDDENTVSSPFKDEEQRKKDFLDNTLEISPIKTMSPLMDKKSASPETSSDYVVIKLSSPVQSNGEPFDKCDSPEIFTEDKISPDKRDLSPPREENIVNNTSPSSSLSLKKNRPQVRSGGRAAHMLGLCVPDRLQTVMKSDRCDPEESKKTSPSNTPVRRNLRKLYNSVGGDSSENSEENEESENFLRFKRVLPTSDCSPSVPILKRKLAEITDDCTISPASKRKRVSFHDPPVSTTVSVQKYIEPGGIRSPQNSLLKRQERQNLRAQTVLKSPKRLDNVFKLDTVLTKAVESFTEAEQNSNDITQSMSLDETPALEIVKNSDLNDVDPICPELVDCTDNIDEIAAELSSATMKTMFLKEIENKISSIGDLAKMSELEVNRLCIKAPKIKVAKKVLSDYAAKRAPGKELVPMDTIEILDNEVSPETSRKDVDVQTSIATSDVDMQTVPTPTTATSVQTDEKCTVNVVVQTKESGAKSTKEIISSCLAERPDFVENLCGQLGKSSKQRIAENLPPNAITDIFMKNVTKDNSRGLITLILQKQNESYSRKGQCENDLAFLQEYLSERFDSRDLILFCSQLLAKIHSKPL